MPDATIAALDDLHQRRFGQAELLVDEHGNLVHVETIFTERLGGRDLRVALDEMKRSGKLRPGDRVQIPANDGKYDYVRVIRPAR